MSKSIAISKIRCENPNKKSKTPTLNRNNLMYVATREGVDLTPSSLTGHNENDDSNSVYMRYISERPRSHGLFGNLPAREIDDLDALCSSMYQLSKTQPVFKGVLSLKEEDALTLGYDKKEKWESTLRIALPMVAEQLKIHPTELRWVAAFHQEKGHPHVHYMLWTDSDKIISSYIHTSTQHKCREIFSKHIFAEERSLYIVDKTIARDDIIASGKNLIQEELAHLHIPGSVDASITGRIQYENLSDLSKDLLEFYSTLPSSGRLAYKYLPLLQKKALDHIVEQFLSVSPLKAKYQDYQKSMLDIMKSYSVVGEKETRKLNQANADIKRRLGNVILKELKNFCLIPDQDQVEFQMNLISNETHRDIPDSDHIGDSYKIIDLNESNEIPEPLEEVSASTNDLHFSMDWSKNYKKARSLIYDNATEQTIEEGIRLLEKEAGCNNVLAIYELAHVYEANLAAKDAKHISPYTELYCKALEGFLALYPTASEKQKDYIAYRIGKQYMRSQGCDMDYSEAASWFEKSSNQYAKYSLAKIYLKEEAEPNAPDEKIVALLQDSSIHNFGYASYQLGAMYDLGNLVDTDKKKSFSYYENALSYFIQNSHSATDSSIFFRLGTMYYRGKGTEQNIPEAAKYFEKAASLGNINALLNLSKIYANLKDYNNLGRVSEKIEQHLEKLNKLDSPNDEQINTASMIHYHLARIYSDNASPLFNLEHGLFYYQLEAENGNQYAQYQLGKIFSAGDLVPKNLSMAISYFTEAATQGNNDARYALGKIYSDTDLGFYDISKAIDCFTPAAAEGHAFSQYRLGKIFSNPELDIYDLEKAINYFTAAANQGNEFALYNLGKIYSDEESGYFDLELALKSLHAAAAQGNEQAIYKLGTIYANKEYQIYDIETALKFYHRAIDEFNNSYAKYQVGKMYLFGNGVNKNVVLGMEYLKDSAQDGNEYATALISYYQRNQMLCISYTISRGMLDVLSNQTYQNRQYGEELAHASTSKKHRKEMAKKNQIKSSEPE